MNRARVITLFTDTITRTSFQLHVLTITINFVPNNTNGTPANPGLRDQNVNSTVLPY